MTKKIRNFIVVSVFIFIGIILAYIISSPQSKNDPIEDSGDIQVSNPGTKRPIEMTLEERLTDIGNNSITTKLTTAVITDLSSGNIYSVIVPKNPLSFEDDFEKYVLSKEVFTNSISFTFEANNAIGETLVSENINGELFISYAGKKVKVVEPDLIFNNGTIILVDSAL